MRRPPKLIGYLLHHAAWGMCAGCIFTFSLIWGDVLGIGTAIETSAIATFMLFFQMALTFGAVWMGIAVMLLGDGEDD